MHISICMYHEPITSSIGSGTTVGKRAPKNKIFYPYPGTTAVIDHGITTRRAVVEHLQRVGVVQMEVGSAVTRTSSRAARPYAADAAPPRYPHVREEALRSGLLGPRRRPRAWARRRGGTVARPGLLFTRGAQRYLSYREGQISS